MSIISLLPTDVIDQIAAGEVVERPAQLIKELVENSLDAHSTEIQIEFDQGGKWVCIKDNGNGMDKEDLKLSLSRHATSKIHKYTDLWSLGSFGFRGEALASIAAVSEVKIISRTAEAKTAYQLVSHFSKLEDIQKVSGDQGTQIFIENLFTNVPARLKFLKSDGAEVTQIKNTLKAIAMANPDVSFKVKTKGKILWLWPAEEKKQRVLRVLGNEELHLANNSYQNITVEALLSNPSDVTKTNRQIWIFVNNRWVQDKGIAAAVLDAYRNLLMHGEYPYAAIWVNLPSDEVDVNIHPTKSQVKFIRSSDVYKAVSRAVREKLQQAPWLESMGVKNIELSKVSHRGEKQENLSFKDHELKRSQYSQKKWHQPASGLLATESVGLEQLRESSQRPSYNTDSLEKESVLMGSDNKNEVATELDHFLNERSLEYGSADQAHSEKVDPLAEDSINFEDIALKKSYWSQLQVLGQANLTYIIAQRTDSMVLVDQHASHERVLFERLMYQWESGSVETQYFLMPIDVVLEEDHLESLLQIKDEIEKLGFVLQKVNDAVLGVSAAPAFVNEKSIQSAVVLLAKEVFENGGSFSIEKHVGDIFASMACHSAIRAGQSLSLEEMKQLFVDMDQYPFSSYCPHGRPVSIDFKWSELDKLFGRIV